MAILHVRNVADDLYQEIQERARLQSALSRNDRTAKEILASIAARRDRRPPASDGPSSLELLREGRDR